MPQAAEQETRGNKGQCLGEERQVSSACKEQQHEAPEEPQTVSGGGPTVASSAAQANGSGPAEVAPPEGAQREGLAGEHCAAKDHEEGGSEGSTSRGAQEAHLGELRRGVACRQQQGEPTLNRINSCKSK